MKISLIPCILFITLGNLFSQSDDHVALKKVLDDFLYNTTYNYADSIAKDFYKEADLYLSNNLDSVWIVSGEEYSDFFRRRKPGVKNNRVGKVVEMKIVNDIAFVEYEVYIPSWNSRFTDLCLLKKIDGQWKFITKVATQEYRATEDDLIPFIPRKDTIIDQLANPWSMAFLNEDEVLVAEKNGGLVQINLLTNDRTEIVGLPNDIAGAFYIDTSQYPKGIFPNGMHGKTSRGNNGLFTILLDPQFSENRYVYLSYSAIDREGKSALRVIRAMLMNGKLVNDTEIFRVQPAVHGIWHYGGGMTIGNDGKLYITAGDRLFYEYVQDDIPYAQSVEDSRGKVFRINLDGSIPEDNPSFGKEVRPGLYATGIRASQGITSHPITNELWFTDHGTNQGDELNVLSEGGNYGWPIRTSGTYRSDDFQPKEMEGATYIDPIHYWKQTIAPTGLTFYTGTEFPAWKNNLFISGLSGGSLWRLVLDGNSVLSAEEIFLSSKVRSRGIVQSPKGKLYLLTDEDNGKIIRITR